MVTIAEQEPPAKKVSPPSTKPPPKEIPATKPSPMKLSEPPSKPPPGKLAVDQEPIPVVPPAEKEPAKPAGEPVTSRLNEHRLFAVNFLNFLLKLIVYN